MVEYVGIPYSEIVRNAILPATLSYIGLFYIVHLEALKLDMQPILQREPKPWRDRAAAHGARHLRDDRRRLPDVLPARAASSTCSATRRRRSPAPSSLALYVGRDVHGGARVRTCPTTSTSRIRSALDTWPAVEGGPALPAADRHADLVPDDRGAVAVAVGVLGDRHADRADGHAAPLIDFFRGDADARCVAPRARATSCSGIDRRLAQHDRHRRRDGDGRRRRRRDHADRARPADDRVRRVRLAGQRHRDAAVHRVRVPGARASACRRPRTTCWSRR